MIDRAEPLAIRSDLADVPARWSWISHFMSSALHARHAALHGKEPTAAMKLGTAGHAVTFEQPFEVFREVNPKSGKVWNRSAKAWKDAKADRDKAGVALITVGEYDKACRIRDALRGHADAAHLLFGAGVVREQNIRWTRHGRACSSTPDARKPGDWVADLKCTRTAKPAQVTKAARWNGWPGQLAFYREADCHDTGRHIDALGHDLYIVAIEPFAPYAVTVFELDAITRDFGSRQVTLCWEALVQAEAINQWPAYVQAIAPLVVDDADDSDMQFIDDATAVAANDNSDDEEI
ncbi:MAG: PD-(D/E)XK nuclease-like domain-containing protein [Kofleriaceae bacterium]|nr:PD-(D/E)XK nuclease-like domain-containing protein [Kofleriaceae bacterium]